MSFAAINIQMLSFCQFIREIYSEPDDSTFTHNGREYDLNGLLSATLGMQTQQFAVSRLTWIFRWSDPFDDAARIDSADLEWPILVTGSEGRLVVLDGLHRLAKAKILQKPTIKGILVPDELLNRYCVRQA
jgi:hypothetical protein